MDADRILNDGQHWAGSVGVQDAADCEPDRLRIIDRPTARYDLSHIDRAVGEQICNLHAFDVRDGQCLAFIQAKCDAAPRRD